MKASTKSKGGWRSRPWNQKKYQAFAREIDQVRQATLAKMGPDDVAYLKRIRKKSLHAEILGRLLLFVSLEPLSWTLGAGFLFIHKQIDSIEIGHHALHGAWDLFAGCEGFYSKDHRWNTPVEETSWKRVHNILHHQYTNIIGKDPDINYSFLRISEKTPWEPRHSKQTLKVLGTSLSFPWLVNLYVTGVVEFLNPITSEEYVPILPNRKPQAVLKAFWKSAKKLVPYSIKEFFFWPLLAGPGFLKVLTGNLTADVLRNIWCWASIYPGHFGEDLPHYDEKTRPHGRGEWYRSQIEATHNFSVPKIFELLTGGMEHQIEHHLFPKFPPNRLREIAPKIKNICEKYGVSYTQPSWGEAIRMALKKVSNLSLPTGTPALKAN